MKTLILIIMTFFLLTSNLVSQEFSKLFTNNSIISVKDSDITITENHSLLCYTQVEKDKDFRKSIVLIKFSILDEKNDSFLLSASDTSFSISCETILPITNKNLLISGICSLNNQPPYYPFIMSVNQSGAINWAKKIDVWNGAANSSFLKVLSDSSILYFVPYNDGEKHKVLCKISPEGEISNLYETNHYSFVISDVFVNEGSFDVLLTDGNLINISNDFTKISPQKKFVHEIGVALTRAQNGDLILATVQKAFPGHMTVSRLDTDDNVIWSKYLETWIGQKSFPFDIVGFHRIKEGKDGNIHVFANSEGGLNGTLKATFSSTGDYISNTKTTSFHNTIKSGNSDLMLYSGFKNQGSYNSNDFVLYHKHINSLMECDTTMSYTIENGNQTITNCDTISFVPYGEFVTNDIEVKSVPIEFSISDYCDIKPVSIEDDSESPNFTIFPNPSSEYITITSDYPIKLISIFSMDGELILESKSDKINITLLPQGVYIVQIKNLSGVHSRTLIKVN